VLSMRFAASPLSPKDIIIHVIPGAIALALVLWFLDGFAGMIINLFSLGTGVVSLVMWFLGAYVAGVFVQLLRGVFGGEKSESLTDRISAQLLAESDERFSSEFKRELISRAKKIFGAAATEKELYGLSRSCSMQHGATRRAESLSAFGEMYRGLLISTRIGLIVSLLIAVKQVILLLLPQFNIVVAVTGFLDYETVHLVVGILLTLLFAVSTRMLKSRIQSCAEAVVSDVYMSFYALSGSQSVSVQ
jgi:hypothetical protein